MPRRDGERGSMEKVGIRHYSLVRWFKFSCPSLSGSGFTLLITDTLNRQSEIPSSQSDRWAACNCQTTNYSRLRKPYNSGPPTTQSLSLSFSSPICCPHSPSALHIFLSRFSSSSPAAQRYKPWRCRRAPCSARGVVLFVAHFPTPSQLPQAPELSARLPVFPTVMPPSESLVSSVMPFVAPNCLAMPSNDCAVEVE